MCFKRSIWLMMLGVLPLISIAQSLKGRKVSRSYWASYAHPINTSFSVEARIGTALYTGELSNLADRQLQNGYQNYSWGFGIDYRLTHYVKIALKAKRFRLSSDSEPEFWNNRSFTTKNMQYTVNLEHNIFPHGVMEDLDKRVNGYVTVGIGVNRFRAAVSDPPEESPELLKEISLVIPIGAGVAYYINQTTHVALEGHYYTTGTDNLDGTFLGSGTGGQNDGYLLFEIKYCWQVANGFVYRNHLKRNGM